MTKNISILGCGWLGFSLARYWQNKGYEIKGSSRNNEKLSLLEKEGIEAFRLDIESIEGEENWHHFLMSDVLVVDIPNKNVGAHQKLSKLITNSEVKQIIYTSSTSVYHASECPVTEESIIKKDNPLVIIEKIYQATGISTCILRLSGLVGPDRHPGRFFRRRPDASLAKVPINLVHLDDVIKVMDWVLEHLPVNDVFNVTSIEHPPKFDFYSKAYLAYFGKQAQFQFNQDQSAHKLINAEKIVKRTQLELSLQKYYPDLL